MRSAQRRSRQSHQLGGGALKAAGWLCVGGYVMPTLYLNVTIGPLAGGEEASADEWKRRLGRMHFRRKYWYLRPVGKPLRFVMIRVLRSLRSTAHARRSAAKFRS
jgi:hypothetical protein